MMDRDLISTLYEFVGEMLERLMQKEEEGFTGWEKLTESDCRKRIMWNLEKCDYVDVANLCMFALLAREWKTDKEEGND